MKNVIIVSPEEKKAIEEISIKYGKTINEFMRSLAEVVKEGQFCWSTPYGTLEITIKNFK